MSTSSIRLPPPTTTLFPYTTLFRSHRVHRHLHRRHQGEGTPGRRRQEGDHLRPGEERGRHLRGRCEPHQLRRAEAPRSEEHTSELQSRGHLVCRLLLEKKKKRSK